MTNNYCNNKMIENKQKTIKNLHKYYRCRIAYEKTKELLKYKQKIRGDLKKLCMTERWQIWEDKDIEDMNSIKASD